MSLSLIIDLNGIAGNLPGCKNENLKLSKEENQNRTNQ